jgi:hypothetical protein
VKYIFFTKTLLNEPPRLRHELLELLLSEGHEVLFCEKPSCQFGLKGIVEQREGLLRFKEAEFIHHRLRFGVLNYLERVHWRRNLKRIKSLPGWENAIVVNFNYDYDFLRYFFPESKIITVFNDDFEGMTKIGFFNHRKKILRTISRADVFLTTSDTLRVKYNDVAPKSRVFYPWIDNVNNSLSVKRDSKRVLYWGFVTQRIDYQLLAKLADTYLDYDFYIAGPCDSSSEGDLGLLLKGRDNIKYCDFLAKESLVSGGYLCSITPSLASKHTVNISVTNKLFKLLNAGIPVINYGLPDFIEAPGVYNCKSVEDFGHAAKSICFDSSIDDSIKGFLGRHTKHCRLNEFMALC